MMTVATVIVGWAASIALTAASVGAAILVTCAILGALSIVAVPFAWAVNRRLSEKP